ncbi:MAG: N-acetyltransferase [Leptospiraceae bacterium]|nr:N-acetyltransferase [Leptospiraceae bacterium]
MSLTDFSIVPANETHLEIIRKIHRRAFNQEEEAGLTIAMLHDDSAMPRVSLIAMDKDAPVGHILFTRVYIQNEAGEERETLAHILAPMAVLPEYQKLGIGGKLIEAGIAELQRLRSELVFVLGHPDYYPRYGFIPDAAAYGYKTPFAIPPEAAPAWMYRAIANNVTKTVSGTVRCCLALNKEMYWRE